MRLEAADRRRNTVTQPTDYEREDDDDGAHAADENARVAHRQFADVG